MRLEDYEGICIVVLAVAFTAWERVRPARPLDRKAEWKRDAVAVLGLVIGVNLARLTMHGLFTALDVRQQLAGAPWRTSATAVQIAACAVTMDFGLYWAHRASHTRWLWATHRWHHSAPNLYWVSGLRTSIFNAMIYAIPQIGLAFYVFDLDLPALVGIAAGGLFFQYFMHANVSIPDRPLNYLVVTPGFHRVHHSNGVLRHGNYGTVFTIWDRLFGTYVDPATVPRDAPTGIDERPSVARMLAGV